MKKMLMTLGIIMALATSASAWECKAQSPFATGYGWSDNLFNAQQIALNECSMRTPSLAYCQIVYCQ